MGLLESIGKVMSKLFKSQIQGWEDRVTLDQIDELEKQGCDVAELRAKYFERKKAEEDAEQKLISDSLAALDLSKLDAYAQTPRDADSQFLKDTSAITGRRAKTLTEAPIVYGAVVQAHSALWEPGNNERTGIVVVFAEDDHMRDVEWLTAMADKVSELKDSLDTPKDSRKFIDTLRNSQSYFCFKLGDSINEGANVWCATYTLDKQSYLPLNYIPANRIIPFLLIELSEENQFAQLEIIPAAYYTK